MRYSDKFTNERNETFYRYSVSERKNTVFIDGVKYFKIDGGMVSISYPTLYTSIKRVGKMTVKEAIENKYSYDETFSYFIKTGEKEIIPRREGLYSVVDIVTEISSETYNSEKDRVDDNRRNAYKKACAEKKEREIVSFKMFYEENKHRTFDINVALHFAVEGESFRHEYESDDEGTRTEIIRTVYLIAEDTKKEIFFEDQISLFIYLLNKGEEMNKNNEFNLYGNSSRLNAIWYLYDILFPKNIEIENFRKMMVEVDIPELNFWKELYS